MISNERYSNIIGLRGYACIGILMMHVLTNFNGQLEWQIANRFIKSFTDLTYLFMIISSFSLCCGYYESIKNNSFDVNKFYIRRYIKIWPFFSILCTLDLFMNLSMNTLIEWFVDLTISFGFIHNHDIGVIGVGWFLGTIFVFYMIFPFFVFLLWNKKRAWFSFFISILLYYACALRFIHMNRTDIIYDFMFFVSGGLIYLYREFLMKSKFKSAYPFLSITFIILYYSFDYNLVFLLCAFDLLIIISISYDGKLISALLLNPIIRFIGKMSMQIYLCHMVAYRIIEKTINISEIEKSIVNYMFLSIGVLIIAVLMSLVIDAFINKIL